MTAPTSPLSVTFGTRHAENSVPNVTLSGEAMGEGVT